MAAAAMLLTLLLASCSDEPETSPVETPVDATDHPIVYNSGTEGGGPFDLWLMKEDGSDAQRLTDEPGTEQSPDWSPDGKRIAFVGTGTGDTSDIFVINSDGTSVRQVTDTGDKVEDSPTWSPDGTRLLYTSGAPDAEAGELLTVDVDDPEGEPATVAAVGAWGDWSSDGSQILYTGLNEAGVATLWVVNVDGSGARMLDLPDVANASESSWGPDGRIAFVAPSGPSDASGPVEYNEDIWVMNLDGTGAEKVVTSPGNDHWPPAWSADGDRLMFTADGEENVSEVAVVDVASGEVTALTDSGDVYEMMPSWRPSR